MIKILVNNRIWSWGGSSHNENESSLVEYIEKNADRIRARYIEHVHHFGHSVVRGKNLVENLKIDTGFSVWWMNLVTEKSIYKSPDIFNCLKLIALQEILEKETPQIIQIQGKQDEKVFLSIISLCLNMNIRVTDAAGRVIDQSGEKYKNYNLITTQIKSGIKTFILYIKDRWCFRSEKEPSWSKDEKSVFIFSYMMNPGMGVTHSGAGYLSGLPEVLYENGYKTSWIYHLVFDKNVSSQKFYQRHLHVLNSDNSGAENHYYLDCYLSFSVLYHVIFNWLRFVWFSLFIKEIKTAFQCPNQTINYWFLIKNDWYSSVIGSVAIKNLFRAELINAAMGRIPRHNLGLYIYEGQGWEKAFIYAWKQYGHGKLLAVSHTTIRYWDLRHFHHALETSDNHSQLNTPLPDKIAVNGPVPRRILLDSGYSDDQLVSVEALRYLNIVNNIHSEPEKKTNNNKYNLLVLGSINKEETEVMLKMISLIPDALLEKFKITVKFHPLNKISLSNEHGLDINVSAEPVNELLACMDMVFGANPTAANLDAYVNNIPVVVYRDKNKLNLSPLAAVKNVRFISNQEQLITSLQSIKKIHPGIDQEYFWLNKELPKWKYLLNNLANI